MKPRPTPAPQKLPSARPRFYRITYSNCGPEDDAKLFQGRDGLAFNELTAPLPALGYDFGTTIHFYSDDQRALGTFPAFQPADLLVLPTRPPLTDRECLIPPRKIIRNSRNELEKLIFRRLFKYFAYCTRKHVQLTAEAQKFLLTDVDRWKFIEFFENHRQDHPLGTALIQKHPLLRKKHHDRPPSTVAFLVRSEALAGVDNTPGVKCGFLASFGMDGYSTLIWNHLVRTRYPHWLATPGFVMAELIFKQPIPTRPLTIEFAADPAFLEVNLLTKPVPAPPL